MADPITPEERSRRLAAARTMIQKGPAAGMVDRDTALMMIEVAETAVLESERLKEDAQTMAIGTIALNKRLRECERLNLSAAPIMAALVADAESLSASNKRLRVGLVVIQDIVVTTIANEFLNEAGAKAALREINAVIQGVTK